MAVFCDIFSLRALNGHFKFLQLMELSSKASEFYH